MAKAPAAATVTAATHAGRSPAQVAAGKKFAAAGRASQAKARAAGKKPSAAQHRAALKWAAAGRASQAARRAGQVPKKKAAAVAPEAAALLRGWWALGCNDVVPTCASVAVANHLMAHTGLMMTEGEVLALHEMAGGEDGASVADVLEVLHERHLELLRGSAWLQSFTRTDEEVIVAGLVVGFSLPHARHAVLSHPRGMVSWGRVMPWAGVPDEAWALEWSR